jgi:hypothetical protein
VPSNSQLPFGVEADNDLIRVAKKVDCSFRTTRSGASNGDISLAAFRILSEAGQ